MPPSAATRWRSSRHANSLPGLPVEHCRQAPRREHLVSTHSVSSTMRPSASSNTCAKRSTTSAWRAASVETSLTTRRAGARSWRVPLSGSALALNARESRRTPPSRRSSRERGLREAREKCASRTVRWGVQATGAAFGRTLCEGRESVRAGRLAREGLCHVQKLRSASSTSPRSLES